VFERESLRERTCVNEKQNLISVLSPTNTQIRTHAHTNLHAHTRTHAFLCVDVRTKTQAHYGKEKEKEKLTPLGEYVIVSW